MTSCNPIQHLARLAIGSAAVCLAIVPDLAWAQRGTGSRGANFARGMMSRGGGGGGGGGRGSAGAISRSGGGRGGNGGMRAGPGPSVSRGGGNYSRRGGGRGRANVGIGLYGGALGLYYGSGFGGYGIPGYGYGIRPYGIPYGYGVPYYGVTPGYTRYGYSYRANPAYNYVRPSDAAYRVVTPNYGQTYAAPNAVQLPPNGQVVTSRAPSAGGAIIPAAAAAAAFQAQAEQAFRDNRIDEALRQSSHAVVEDQQNGKLHLFASQALFAAGRYEEATDALRVAMTMLPPQDRGYVVQNYKQFYRGTNYVDQMSRLVRFMDENPEAPYARTLRGYHYKYLGYEDAARKQLAKATELDPNDPLPQLLANGRSEASDDDAVEVPGPPVGTTEAMSLDSTVGEAENDSPTSDALQSIPSEEPPNEAATEGSQADLVEELPGLDDSTVEEASDFADDPQLSPPSLQPPPVPNPEGR